MLKAVLVLALLGVVVIALVVRSAVRRSLRELEAGGATPPEDGDSRPAARS